MPTQSIDASIGPATISPSIDLASDKVHIRGLDDLTTKDIEFFSLEHFSIAPERIEWIDDTSANLVFDAPNTASDALSQLTSASIQTDSELSPLDLRPAKIFTSHSNLNLQVRIALATDRKRPRAHETSRFYLLHPEHDPREQRRRRGGRDNSTRDYRRRRYSDEEDRRRRRKDTDDGFDASMYDDNGPSSAHNTAASSPIGRSRRDVDSYRPLRDRSASPHRSDSTSRRRKRTPPPSYRPHDPDPFPRENKDKELFPQRIRKPRGKDLFSNKLLATKMKKDLFPHKASASNHRRTDAFDAADETADLFAGRMTVPFTDGASGGKSLAQRITKAPESAYGRLNGKDETSIDIGDSFGHQDQALSIRGASSQGFSIKGGASHVGTIKDLFPGKANAGKELFAEKLQGRGGPRTKAEDLFY